MKIGIDIIEIERIKDAVIKQARFSERVFTAKERMYCEGRGKQQYESLAGIFAAKEAFVKALGIGFRKGSWQEIEVDHDEWGAPVLQCTGVFKEIFEDKGYRSIQVSISHCHSCAISEVLIEE